MKLYYAPGACSLTSRIALHEAGLTFTEEKVDLKTHQLADGGSFLNVSKKGYVPLLVLENGEKLTEAGVILQWIADLAPEKNLLPKAGSLARMRVLEWLSYIATELHKSFSPAFNPALDAQTKAVFNAYLIKRLALADEALANTPFLTGEDFTIADIYLFVVCVWAKLMHTDIAAYKNLHAFAAKVATRAAVQKALSEEGLQ